MAVQDLPKLVAACCVLHNLCEIHGESFDVDWMPDDTNHASLVVHSTYYSAPFDNSGRDVREALTTLFSE